MDALWQAEGVVGRELLQLTSYDTFGSIEFSLLWCELVVSRMEEDTYEMVTKLKRAEGSEKEQVDEKRSDSLVGRREKVW